MPDNTVPLQPAVKDPNNVEAKKYYVFNETGNIMLSSTIDPGQPIEETVRRIFAEVSVFFAGMTRAISTTTNPATGKPYSIYNYEALQRIIGGSGLFVAVNEEDVKYTTRSFGVDFSKELIEALLGLATGSGELAFASAMVSAIGKEGIRISGSESESDSRVGNIVFVCEYLLGMPIVSALVVYAEVKEHKQQLQIGPCFKEQSIETVWTLHKDTYMFVTPAFIREYSSDLASIRSDPDYVMLINWLQGLLTGSLKVTGLLDDGTPPKQVPSGSPLAVGSAYTITGEFLPAQRGTLKFKDSVTGTATVSSWSPTMITFTVGGTQTTAVPIEIYGADGKLAGSTPGGYTIKAGPKLKDDVIDIGGITSPNPHLWLRMPIEEPHQYVISTDEPAGEWLDVNQFCSLLSLRWLQARAQGGVPVPYGLGQFGDAEKRAMARQLIAFPSQQGQTDYAVEQLPGAIVSLQAVVAGMAPGTPASFPAGTRIWAGTAVHVVAYYVRSAAQYECYDPDTGMVTTAERDDFQTAADTFVMA